MGRSRNSDRRSARILPMMSAAHRRNGTTRSPGGPEELRKGQGRRTRPEGQTHNQNRSGGFQEHATLSPEWTDTITTKSGAEARRAVAE